MNSTPNSSEAGLVLVALGSDARALGLLYAAQRLARDRDWAAVHVEVPQLESSEELAQARLWLQEAQELGAQIHWVRSGSIVSGLLTTARNLRAESLLVGRSQRDWPWDRLGHSTAQELQRKTTGLNLLLYPPPEAAESLLENPRETLGAGLAALFILAACTGAGLILPWGGELGPALLAFLPGIAFISHRWGRVLSTPALLLASALYLFLFAHPRGSFRADNLPDFLFFTAMLFVAQRGMELVGRLGRQTRQMQQREGQAIAIFLLGRALSRCSSVEELSQTLRHHFPRYWKREARLLLAPSGPQGWISEEIPGLELSPELLYEHLISREPAEGLLTPLRQGDWGCLLLSGSQGAEGILLLSLKSRAHEDWDLFHAFAAQIGLALERIRWLEKAQQARLETETERLRSDLLSAISHDLKTPLAAIEGAASSLALAGNQLPDPTRKDLLAMIQGESQRLARLLGNLLDLTRLESGTFQLKREWQSVEEMLGAALGVLERSHGGCSCQVRLQSDLPLMSLDGALIQQLLLNLLINAQRHSQGSSIELSARQEAGGLRLEVMDRGPGVPQEWRDKVFEKFFRLPGGADGGAGLGLAICRAIVKVHEGQIRLLEREGGGTVVQVDFPLMGEPPGLGAFEPGGSP